MNWADRIEQERALYQRAPLSELRAVRLALSLHSWGNSLQERARPEAVDQLVHERLRSAAAQRKARSC